MAGFRRKCLPALATPISRLAAPSIAIGIILWSKNRFNPDGGAGLRLR
jgi:hypothetical protein